ncbi:MAG: Ca-activated chloride channel family protein [Mariniblastus sp.]|jgi:Ca-activated chloride channel family protein
MQLELKSNRNILVKLNRKISQIRSTRDGAMLPLIAVTITILFVAAVLSIDIARIHVARSELRTATDAAARAGVEALGREQSQEAGFQAAIDIASKNKVSGSGLVLERSDILFGTAIQANDRSYQFLEGGLILNSIKILGEKKDVPMLFGKLFGSDSFSPVQTATAARLDRDIAMVLDVSGSMNSRGRFTSLHNGVDVFLAELNKTSQRERVSLTVYSSIARKLVPLTENHPLISTAMDSENPRGATAIGRGLNVGLHSVSSDPIARPFALKSIVLMTDGNHNTGVSPELVARACKRAGVVVHTITFSAGANQTAMKKVADRTGGTHVHAVDNAQLEAAFGTIAKQLQVLLIE